MQKFVSILPIHICNKGFAFPSFSIVGEDGGKIKYNSYPPQNCHLLSEAFPGIPTCLLATGVYCSKNNFYLPGSYLCKSTFIPSLDHKAGVASLLSVPSVQCRCLEPHRPWKNVSRWNSKELLPSEKMHSTRADKLLLCDFSLTNFLGHRAVQWFAWEQ